MFKNQNDAGGLVNTLENVSIIYVNQRIGWERDWQFTVVAGSDHYLPGRANYPKL